MVVVIIFIVIIIVTNLSTGFMQQFSDWVLYPSHVVTRPVLCTLQCSSRCSCLERLNNMMKCFERCVNWQRSSVSCHWRRCLRLVLLRTCRQHLKIKDKRCCGAGWKRQTLTHLNYAGITHLCLSLLCLEISFLCCYWVLKLTRIVSTFLETASLA